MLRIGPLQQGSWKWWRYLNAAILKIFLLVAALSLCHAAELHVEVSATSATQAILRYRAPITRACNVEVSESSSFRPLVHDVDPALFPEGGSDARSGLLNHLRDHVIVVGRRKAEKALDGRWYSRALQANTVHYYRVDCGVAQASGSFRTANISLGNSYNEMFPADPDATGFRTMGSYAWPEFLSWTDRSETVVDPQTGILLKRLTMPQDYPIDWLGDESVGSVIDLDGKWNNPDAVKTDDATAATFSGAGSNWLFLRDDNLTLGDAATGRTSYLGRTIDYFQVQLKAWCSGGCAAEDRKVELCLTVDGMSCASAIREASLGTGAVSRDVAPMVIGTTTPILDYWTAAGSAPLDRTEFAVRLGTVDVNGKDVVWTGGTYFNMRWRAGSRIGINGREYEIAAVKGLKALTLKVDAGGGSSVPYSAANSGVLVRKKTSSNDSVSIQYAHFKLGISHLPEEWPSSGSPEICQGAVTLDARGNEGFRCVISDAVPVVYWVDRSTGDGKPLGGFSTDSREGVDGWSNSFCSGFFSSVEINAFYCVTTDNSAAANTIVLKCKLMGSNEPYGWKPVCSNLTPASKGASVPAQLTAFTGGKFNATKFGCGVSGIQNERILLNCKRSGQDSLGWVAVFDPAKAQPECSPGNLCIIAAQNTWSTAPARWCGLHTPFYMGAVDWYWVAGNNLYDAGGPGQGPYGSQITSGALSAKGMTACPASAADPSVAGQLLCSTVTVDGEPRDTSPHGDETGAPGELQDAAIGDVLRVEGEWVQLLAKNGNSWTVRRGFGASSPADHPAGLFLMEECLARRFDRDTSDWSWSWDYLHDPIGANPQGLTVRREYDFDHPAGRAGLVVGMASYLDCFFPSCYAARTSGMWGGPPDVLVNGNQGFAGVAAGAPGNFAEDHASYAQVMAPESEKRWMLDGRPLTPGPDLSRAFTPVGGQLYKLSTNTSDGDDLVNGNTHLSRRKMPTFAFCGTQPLSDTSSAATGDVLGTTASDSFKYCVSRKANECRAGSQSGDIWVNCPVVTTPACAPATDQGNATVGICLVMPHMYLSSMGQIGFAAADANAGLGRKLTMGLGRNLLLDGFWNARALPDASWMIFRSVWLGGVRTEVLLAKLPPYPQQDSIDRSSFVAMTVPVAGSIVAGTDNVVVQFGYEENGSPSDFFCTSRREACVQGPGPEYAFSGDNVPGVSCSGSCSVTIPALSGRMLYYRIVYRDSQNQQLALSSPAVALVP